MIINKVNNTIRLLRKLHKDLWRSHQLTAYKPLVRLHLNYGGIISNQDYKFSPEIGTNIIRLAITIAIEDTS